MPQKYRRRNGEGSVFQRKNGSWVGQVCTGYDDKGKLKRITFYGKDREEVLKKLRKTLVDLDNQTYIDPTQMTFGEWLDVWLHTFMKTELKQSTWESYRIQINKHIKPYIGNIKLQKIRAIDLQKVINIAEVSGRCDNKEGGLAPKSVRYIYTVFHSALQDAVDQRIISYNPASPVKRPKKRTKEIDVLTREEINSFLIAAADISNCIPNSDIYISKVRNYLAFLLAINTGLRRGELLGLRWGDITIDTGKITIKQQLIRSIDKGLIFVTPKTKTSERTLNIPKDLCEQLKKYRDLQNLEKERVGNLYQDNDLVFCSSDGKPKDPRSFSRYFLHILEKAKIKKVGLHSLRHTYATNLLRLGVDIKTLSALLGHKSAAFTLEVYSHVLKEMEVNAFNQTESYMAYFNKEITPWQNAKELSEKN